MARRGNKRQIVLAIVLLTIASTMQASVELGIDVLKQNGYALLRGKRVGLITNQTSVDSSGNKTRVLLHQHCNLVALYTPEHGLNGTGKAGRYVKSQRDPVTGLPAYSLYGPTRKPTPSMLRGIDVLVFDLQDIGCRGYTYISTMGLCMEAAAENNIDFVVLDRPNPLGGSRIEGPSVNPGFISFVSQFPVPYVHGMTVGELAQMVNAKGWIHRHCNLAVVPMRGWTRSFTWNETGLRWIPTSPNVPRSTTPVYYVATGLVGELAGVETGVGGYRPFEMISASWLNAESFTRHLQSLNMPGVSFSEFRRGRQQGSILRIEPKAPADLTALGIYMLAELNRASGSNLFRRSGRGKLDIFFKIYGSALIRSQLERSVSPVSIVDSWQSQLANFRAARLPYLLY
jgi:uncharacterized protein YbbC (DUF1343 family)